MNLETMRKVVKGGVLLILMLLSMKAAAQISVPSDPDQAREIVGMIAKSLNSQRGRDDLANKVGRSVDISAWVDDDALVFAYNVDGYEAGSDEGVRELVKLGIVSNRNNGRQAQTMVLMSDLLKKAGYNYRAVYMSEGKEVVAMTFSPDELKRLVTEPLEALDLNYNLALGELLSVMQTGMDKEAGDVEGLIYEKVRLDGDYITMEMGFEDSKLESVVRAPDVNQGFVELYVHELLESSGTPFLINQMINLGQFMGLRGLKMDFRSPSGLQKVVLIPWDKLQATVANPSKTPNTDLFIESMRSAIGDIVRNPENGIAEAYVRYKAPDVELLIKLDTDDLSMRNMAEEKASWLAETVDDDFVATMKELAAEGVKTLRYIYTDKGGWNQRVMEVTIEEVLRYGGSRSRGEF